MGKYAEDAKQLLRLVGGKENIAAVSHCMTRMRFVLVEPQKADVKAIEAMKVVKGSFTQSGQFQVIIGNTVADFYNDFVKEAGIEGVSKDAVKQAAKKNQTVLQRVIAALAEIFAPLIPAITEPSRTPARNSSSVRLAKPGLAATSSMAWATSTPAMGPSALFQVQKLVRPSSFNPTCSPVFPKKA